MRYKATFLVGMATGYVLGAKAGRERYEQIRETARQFINDPRVRRAADETRACAEQVMETSARAAAETARQAVEKGREVGEIVSEHLPPRLRKRMPKGHATKAQPATAR
jgi:proteasome assembly chaperone (PAC2) family protein